MSQDDKNQRQDQNKGQQKGQKKGQQKDQLENTDNRSIQAVSEADSQREANRAEANRAEANRAEETDETSASDATKPAKKTTQKSSKAGFFLFMLALILCAFGGGGYGAYYYLNQQALERESALNDGLQRIKDGFNTLQSADKALNRKQDDLQRALTAAVAGTEKQMSALAERLATNESAGPADWTLAEVEYLLRIANQRLITNGDSNTAIDMLQAADGILKELAYPELAVVRRQLAADITGLQLANQADIEGVYFILEAMASEIARLDQFSPEKLAPVELDPSENSSKLMTLWNGVVEALSKYVRIDTEAGEPEYLVSDEQEVVRHLSIQLQLRQAQLALLAGRQEIYSAALSAAADSVTMYYDAVNIANSLAELSGRRVERQSMDVNDSLQALSNVIDQLSRTGSPVLQEK